MSKTKSEPKYKYLDAFYRKHQNDQFPYLPLEHLRANRVYYTEMEQVKKHMARRNDDQGRFNIFHRRRCLNKPSKFRWRNWQRERKRERTFSRAKRLAKVKANGN